MTLAPARPVPQPSRLRSWAMTEWTTGPGPAPPTGDGWWGPPATAPPPGDGWWGPPATAVPTGVPDSWYAPPGVVPTPNPPCRRAGIAAAVAGWIFLVSGIGAGALSVFFLAWAISIDTTGSSNDFGQGWEIVFAVFFAIVFVVLAVPATVFGVLYVRMGTRLRRGTYRTLSGARALFITAEALMGVLCVAFLLISREPATMLIPLVPLAMATLPHLQLRSDVASHPTPTPAWY